MTDFYDEHYRAHPNAWSHPARDEFAFNALSKFPEPASMLDVGCGSGHTLAYFAHRWPETDYYGLDTSRVALELARKKVKSAKFFETLADAPRVGLIIMLGVLEHFPDLSELRNVAAHLAPAGHLYIEVPNCLAYAASKDEGFRKTTGGTGQIEWHLRRSTWEQKLNENGLEIVQSLNGLAHQWEFVWLCSTFGPCRQSNLSIGM